MKSRLVTLEMLASQAAEHFKQVYFSKEQEKWLSGYEEVYTRLLSLGERPSPDAVREIVHPSWVALRCDCCEETQDAVVECGQDEDYSVRPTHLCKKCVQEALSLFSTESL